MTDRKRTTRTASCCRLDHLFDCWPQVARRIKCAGHLVLFLDFDGTLTGLHPRPEDVPPLDLLTRRLASRRQLDLYVISGRRFSDLRSRVRVQGVDLLGLYGWEGRGLPPMRKERELVQRAGRLLATRLAQVPRIWLEDKNLGLAVHHPDALPAEVRAARLIVRGVLGQFKPQLRLLKGKKVWQLLHRAVSGKGPAVRRLLAKRGRLVLPIFGGDGTGDESALVALPGGINVHVGRTRQTQARLYLRIPGEVLTFLQRLEAEIA